jgi:type II secretion system protein N
VQKFTRIVLIVLGAVFVFASVVLLAVNLYVQSQGTQTRIQQELSQRLGTPLSLRQISVTPWGGLKLSGITVPALTARASENFLEAKTFRLRVRLSSLFSRRLVIKEVSLVDPHVIWPQNSDGKWRLPGLAEAENRPAEMAEGLPDKPSAEVTPAEPAEVAGPDHEGTSERMETSRFVPEIRRLKVTGGNFRFLDASGKSIGAFEGLELRSNVRNATNLQGTARVARISLRDRFFLQRMRSVLRYDPGELDLSQISAQIGGGDLAGHFTMQPQMENSPFDLAVRFRQVQADQVITEAGGERGMVTGNLEGNFQAKGRLADPNALNGTGDIALHDGQLRQYSLLVALGQVLQIEELKQLHFEQAEGKYRIESGIVTVDQLILRSPNIRLSAKGTIGLDGKLRLDSKLAINEKIRNQLFKPIRANFQPSTEPGYFAVDFEVGGTIGRPKSNLVEKVVGRDLKEFGSMINTFLGGGKSAKKKKASEAATESPSPGLSQPPTATAAPSP